MTDDFLLAVAVAQAYTDKVAGAVTDPDTTPTAGSTKFVTSGGIYDYINTMITQALSAPY